MTKDELQRLRDLANAAKPGPWVPLVDRWPRREWKPDSVRSLDAVVGPNDVTIMAAAPCGHQNSYLVVDDEDIRFIVAAREAVPNLLDEVERCQGLKIRADVFEHGLWRTCSGCHESNEGHATGPYDESLRCHVGIGCHECGGVGAIWEEHSELRCCPRFTWGDGTHDLDCHMAYHCAYPGCGNPRHALYGPKRIPKCGDHCLLDDDAFDITPKPEPEPRPTKDEHEARALAFIAEVDKHLLELIHPPGAGEVSLEVRLKVFPAHNKLVAGLRELLREERRKGYDDAREELREKVAAAIKGAL